MKIIYSINKKGFEADYWMREIAAASTPEYQFIPFNHDPYIHWKRYMRAQLLDNLYYEEHPDLKRLYVDIENKIKEVRADILLVDGCPPYHPDYLRKLNIYKVLRIADGPMASYDRDFAYLHAYDHILYHSPAYSKDMGMKEKLHYCGAKKTDFWPAASFNALCDTSKVSSNILTAFRDIDIIFIGALHPNKMPILAAMKKAFGKKFKLFGLAGGKLNIYFNLKYFFPQWVRPLPFTKYVSFYQRTRIGINIHNRGKYTVGNYRMFDLPANGVMQISDGNDNLKHFFSVGDEIVPYNNAGELIEMIKYFLENDAERKRIALNGFMRVRNDYKIENLLAKAAYLIGVGLGVR